MSRLKPTWGSYVADSNRSDPEMAGVFPFLIYQRYLWIYVPTYKWHKNLREAEIECERLNRAKTR